MYWTINVILRALFLVKVYLNVSASNDMLKQSLCQGVNTCVAQPSSYSCNPLVLSPLTYQVIRYSAACPDPDMVG